MEASRHTTIGQEAGKIQALESLGVWDAGDVSTPEEDFAGDDLHPGDPVCVSFHHWGYVTIPS